MITRDSAKHAAAMAVVPQSEHRLRSLPEALSVSRRKIETDVLRFRTCCADPRASK